MVDELLGARSPRRSSPGGQKSYCGCVRSSGLHERPFAELDLADSDVDGDTLLDGEDDQDNDDYNNITEMYEAATTSTATADRAGATTGTRPTYPSVDTAGRGPWRINPFNPCAPDPDSRTCHDYKPFD